MKTLRIVILTLLCIFICCAFAGDSYKESKPGNEERKSEVSGFVARQNIVGKRHIHGRERKQHIIIRIQEALWKKLNNLKPLFSGNEEHGISKEVKGNALALKGKSCRPDTTITTEKTCHDLSV